MHMRDALVDCAAHLRHIALLPSLVIARIFLLTTQPTLIRSEKQAY